MNEEENQWHVYLIECSDGKIYTGCTSNLSSRIKSHVKGNVAFTSTRGSLEIKVYITFPDKKKAFDFERYLKTGSGKAFSKKRFL